MTEISSKIVKILEEFWQRNKAKGLLAQTIFKEEIHKNYFGEDAKEKIISGCWLLAPKEENFYKFRFCFFVHPRFMKEDDISSDVRKILGENYRPFHALAGFMNNAGIGVVYAIPFNRDGELPLDEIKSRRFGNIEWFFLGFQKGVFCPLDINKFFGKWEGNRGRAGYGRGWEDSVRRRMELLDENILTELLLNELFYTGFLKTILKKPVSDPYDIDIFLISISQKYIFPVEIKEKFPGENKKEKFFGIDAGRVMMLLRLCIPNDANAIYLIREVNRRGEFIGWKYITLSDIIMTASWNLQRGGVGMGGQDTQTIRLPYRYFKKFSKEEISEDNLRRIGTLPKDVKVLARKFGEEMFLRFYNNC